LIHVHFVGLGVISVVLFDFFEVGLEDGETIDLFTLGVLLVECFLELLELSPGGRVLMLGEHDVGRGNDSSE
jgi:hypothetical protein